MNFDQLQKEWDERFREKFGQYPSLTKEEREFIESFLSEERAAFYEAGEKQGHLDEVSLTYRYAFEQGSEEGFFLALKKVREAQSEITAYGDANIILKRQMLAAIIKLEEEV